LVLTNSVSGRKVEALFDLAAVLRYQLALAISGEMTYSHM
jgi:hypothetical protein